MGCFCFGGDDRRGQKGQKGGRLDLMDGSIVIVLPLVGGRCGGRRKDSLFPIAHFLPSPSLNSTTIRWTLCTRAAAFPPSLSPPPLSPQRLSSYHNNRFFSLLPLIPIPPSLSFLQPEQSSPDGLTLPSHDGRRGGILLRLVILSFRSVWGGGERQFTEL